MRRSPLVGCLALLVGLPAAGAPPVASADARAVGRVRDGAWVVGRAAVPVREGAEIRSVAALASGSIAVGTEPVEGGTELVLLRARGAKGFRWEPPAGVGGRLRLAPVPLTRAGELAGVAWLEGDDHRTLAVYAAPRRGGGWGATERVAGPAPGSQSALTGTVLPDGRWLLAWSAFDGDDDEIVWSLRGDEGWSLPRRLAADNRVPDVGPAVLAVEDGAVVAWSRFEPGGYRVQRARLVAGAWTAPEPAGPAGSLDPTWARVGGAVQLLVRRVRPAAWIVTELDAAGAALRRAEVATTSEAPPVLAASLDRATFEEGDRDLLWRAVP